MKEKDTIRRMFFEEGQNISNINKESGFDRKTIGKYINKTDWSNTVRFKEYKPSKLDKYKPDIDLWIENDKKMRTKQRHTAKRVFNRLKEKYTDFNISYRLTAYYVKEKKKEIYEVKESSLPLIHKEGEAQIDFGKAQFKEKGILYDGSYLAVSFPFSNAGFIQIIKGENFECFVFALSSIFNHINGVPHRQWYDNMSIAVIKILKGHDRKLTNSFIRFKEHYNYTAVFCNPGKGNEKGGVEAKVGYSRRNMLVPMPEFDDMDIFNKELLYLCDKDMNRMHYSKNKLISELFKEDLKYLNPLPSVPFENETYMRIRTDSYGKFTLDNKTYSSAPVLSNSTVGVIKSHDTVTVLDKDYKEVVRHERLYGEKSESIDWIPYLTQLSRKPAAFKYSGIYSMLPLSVKDFIEKTNPSKALKLLARLTKESNFDTAVSLMEKAIEYKTIDLDSLVTIDRMHKEIIDTQTLKLSHDTPKLNSLNLDLEKYDDFLNGGINVYNQ